MFDDDYIEYEDTECPECGHSPIHSQRCNGFGCDDGWIDMHEYDDPLWYDEGEEEMCDECWGTGVQRWCPKCGFDLQRPRRTSGAVDGGEGSDLQAESTPESNPAPEVSSQPTHHH
jgi:hypothetical protein